LTIEHQRVMSTSHPQDSLLPFSGQKRMLEPLLVRRSRARVFHKLVTRPFWRVNESLWNRIPSSIATTRPVQLYGAFLHSLVRWRSKRRQYHGTFFLRNRPELELMRTLANRAAKGATLRIAVLGCSNGAEVYSILWTIRSAWPDLKVIVSAADISSKVVEIAEQGLYPLEVTDLVGSAIFERLTQGEMRSMFDMEEGQARVKPWIKKGIDFHVADAGDPKLPELMGPQDIVVANNFLCHMAPPDAERCLRNLAQLVEPGGYLFVSGVDLRLRAKVAHDLRWTPVLDLIEEIHDGDPCVRRDWPWRWWGLEPFSRKRHDWSIRYCSAFQLRAAGVTQDAPDAETVGAAQRVLHGPQ
jgi:SAM-dependent methyltransferase